MKKMIFTFLTLAAATSTYASKIDDAIKQAEQESEAARAIINKNPFAHAGRGTLLCAPGLDTSKVCSDAQFFTNDKGAVSRYQAALVKLAILEKIAKLDDQEKRTLNQLLNDQKFLSYFLSFKFSAKEYSCAFVNYRYESWYDKYYCSIHAQFKLSNRLEHLLGDPLPFVSAYNNFASYIAQSPENKKFILDLLQ